MVEEDPQIRAKIVKLRKSGTSLLSISKKVGVKVIYVTDILKEELGDQYSKYNLGKSECEFSEQKIKEIVDLRKDGYTLKITSKITKLSSIILCNTKRI